MKKTILITGSSSGFGKAATMKFATNGWNVVATMRTPEKETAFTGFENVLVVKLDVQDNNSIQSAIQAGIDRFGKIDTLLNNAGYGALGNFEAATSEQIRRQFDVNVFGMMDVTRAILPHFRKNKSGTIINISSMGGRITFPLMSLYHASKFAVEGFTESLAYELAALNITVKLVEPGVANTNFGGPSADFIQNPALTDYNDFIQAFWQHFATLNYQSNSAEDITEVIYTAATDNSQQLRYIAGEDAKALMEIRNGKNDQEYIEWMKHTFVPAKTNPS